MSVEVPEGWEVGEISSLCEVNSETLSSKTDPKKEFDYIAIENVSEGVISGSTKTTFIEAPSRARRVVRNGDVIVSTVRPYLKAFASIGPEYNGAVVSTGFCVLRPKNGKSTQSFIDQIVFSETFLDHLTQRMTGSNYPAVKASDIEEYSFALPPLPEQQLIAEILSCVDKSIRATEAVISQAERVKRGLMEDLLTGGLGSAAIANGEVPEGWESLRVDGISIHKGLQTGPFGSQLKASEYCENTFEECVYVVMPKDIVNGRIEYSRCARITRQKAHELSRHALVTGDVLFARRGDLSKIAVVDEADPPSICGTGCLRMRPDLVRVDYQFLRLVFTTHDCVQWLISNAVGATMLNLNTDIIGRLPLLLPPKSVQINIAKSVQSIELTAKNNFATLHQLQRLKRGLMDDLLTGKVRTVA